MTTKLFSELGLSAELLKAIDQLGFEQAAPIQAEAIPLMLQGRDVVGQSQTGSGKTAAFGIPAVERTDPSLARVQVLILCPTRELAVQVSEEVFKLAAFKRGIRALPIYGGQSIERQVYGLRQGAQIVIGTPGRLMDHLRRGTLRLDAVRTVVLDEADTMLDMGFREDIELILQSTPAERQTVFFSATMPRAIRELIAKHSRDPQDVKLEQKSVTVPTVEQVYYEIDQRFKVELLTRLIDLHDLKLGIIFCNTKRRVDDLADHLEAQGYSADRLHGDMSQVQRDRVMNKFRKSGLEFLVATDVAARGIDVDDVQVVFNYDLPYDVEDYVHRIGRTGRAGRSGRAISFVAGREAFQIRNIERFAKTRIHRARVPTLAEVEDARQNLVIDRLRATLQTGTFPRQDPLLERLLDEGFSSTDIASALLHQFLQGGELAPVPAAPGSPVRSRPTPGQPVASAPAAPPPPEPARTEPVASLPAQVRKDTPPAPQAVVSAVPQPGRVQSQRPPSALSREPAVGSPKLGVRSSEFVERMRGPTGSMGTMRTRQAQSTERKAPAPARHGHRREPVGVQSTDRRPKVVAPRPAQPKGPGPVSKEKPAAHATGSRRPGLPTAPPAKESRATPPHQTRLFMNLGKEMGVVPIDVVNAIAGETGLPGAVVGTIDIRERHLFADVAAEHARRIVAKLNRGQIKGQKVKVKLA